MSVGNPLFRFKNSRVSLNELMLLDYDAERLRIELAEHAAKLPSLFRQMPVVLNFDQLPSECPLPPLADLLAICRENELNPIGLRGNHRYDEEVCRHLGLAWLGHGGHVREEEPAKAESDATGSAQPQAPAAESQHSATRILTTPVRSGQQVYVRGGDLIVLSSVSAGAEVMADGNIHVYGTLRGRAMAGVSGDEQARVFCQSLAAELISIAGYFKTSEDLPDEFVNRPVQAFLSGTRLDLAALN